MTLETGDGQSEAVRSGTAGTVGRSVALSGDESAV